MTHTRQEVSPTDIDQPIIFDGMLVQPLSAQASESIAVATQPDATPRQYAKGLWHTLYGIPGSAWEGIDVESMIPDILQSTYGLSPKKAQWLSHKALEAVMKDYENKGETN